MKYPIKKAVIWKQGSGSAVITVPGQYITNGILEIGKEYDLEIEVPDIDKPL